jgi:phytanoyl-CoA hydroxylase
MKTSLSPTMDRDGVVILRQAVTPDAIEDLLTRVELLVHDHVGRLVDDGSVADARTDEPVDTRLASVYADTSLVRPRKWHDGLFGPELHRLVTDAALLEVLAELVGDEVVFHGDHQLVTKLPGCRRTAFGWHQDSQYYGRRAAEARVVTVWIPLVPATEANGCLKVIPGSHRSELLPFDRDNGLNVQVPVDVSSMGRAVTIPTDPGDAILMTHRTLHASDLNHTEGVRWSLDLGYSALGGAASEAARDAERFLHRALLGAGRTPLRVVRDGLVDPEPFSVWHARRSAGGVGVWDDATTLGPRRH